MKPRYVSTALQALRDWSGRFDLWLTEFNKGALFVIFVFVSENDRVARILADCETY
jgi:hypothetical protein